MANVPRVEDILDFSDFVFFSHIFLYTNRTVDIPNMADMQIREIGLISPYGWPNNSISKSILAIQAYTHRYLHSIVLISLIVLITRNFTFYGFGYTRKHSVIFDRPSLLCWRPPDNSSGGRQINYISIVSPTGLPYIADVIFVFFFVVLDEVKIEVARGVWNSKVRKKDKFRRDWSQY